MESHTQAKSLSEHPEKAVAQHPQGATLGTLDLIADVSFSGASLRFCFLSLSLGLWCWDAYNIFVIMFRGAGWVFVTQCHEAAGELFFAVS